MKVYVTDFGDEDMYRDSHWFTLLTSKRRIFLSEEKAKEHIQVNQLFLNQEMEAEGGESEKWDWYHYPEQKEIRWCYSTDKNDETMSQCWVIMEVEVQLMKIYTLQYWSVHEAKSNNYAPCDLIHRTAFTTKHEATKAAEEMYKKLSDDPDDVPTVHGFKRTEGSPNYYLVGDESEEDVVAVYELEVK